MGDTVYRKVVLDRKWGDRGGNGVGHGVGTCWKLPEVGHKSEVQFPQVRVLVVF